MDLRWGITSDESRTGRALAVCLQQIDECRPYFLGFVGNRYGWFDALVFCFCAVHCDLESRAQPDEGNDEVLTKTFDHAISQGHEVSDVHFFL